MPKYIPLKEKIQRTICIVKFHFYPDLFLKKVQKSKIWFLEAVVCRYLESISQFLKIGITFRFQLIGCNHGIEIVIVEQVQI